MKGEHRSAPVSAAASMCSSQSGAKLMWASSQTRTSPVARAASSRRPRRTPIGCSLRRIRTSGSV